MMARPALLDNQLGSGHSPKIFKSVIWRMSLRLGRASRDGMKMQNNSTAMARVEELELELQQLKSLVNTLLTVIAEEADGIQNGAAPTMPGTPPSGYSM